MNDRNRKKIEDFLLLFRLFFCFELMLLSLSLLSTLTNDFDDDYYDGGYNYENYYYVEIN